jgi:hypothetical protein
MTTVSLRADCAQCDALCCIALAFDRSDMFAFDKPAGEPCRNLTACGSCTIHGELSARGFAGCKRFDCLGAGQRVTQEIFPGRTWREGEDIARSMFDAFTALRRVHDLIAILREAGKLPLSPQQLSRRDELLATLQPRTWSPASLAAFGRSGLEAEARSFLASLRSSVLAQA